MNLELASFFIVRGKYSISCLCGCSFLWQTWASDVVEYMTVPV